MSPSLTSRTYDSNETARACGVSLRRIQWWDESGLVRPRQFGHSRQFTLDEVLTVAIVAEMRRKGISLQNIRKLLKRVNAGTGDYLVTDGARSIHVVTTAMDAFSLMVNHNKPMLVIWIAGISRTVIQRLEEMSRGHK